MNFHEKLYIVKRWPPAPREGFQQGIRLGLGSGGGDPLSALPGFALYLTPSQKPRQKRYYGAEAYKGTLLRGRWNGPSPNPAQALEEKKTFFMVKNSFLFVFSLLEKNVFFSFLGKRWKIPLWGGHFLGVQMRIFLFFGFLRYFES